LKMPIRILGFEDGQDYVVCEMRGWLESPIPTNTLILKILKILKILILMMGMLAMLVPPASHQHPNPENPKILKILI
jgi:hypothetical protein